jgi:hypothetical protein
LVPFSEAASEWLNRTGLEEGLPPAASSAFAKGYGATGERAIELICISCFPASSAAAVRRRRLAGEAGRTL